ncbi:MAG TPA: hypothetical protein VMV90_14975 [Rectinemataceae bacterium]|nr:hypothetical protein [Rectinemataceae bacterium]
MNRARIRVLNWTLVGLGIAILALGAAIAIGISSTGAFPGPWFGRGGPGFHAWGGPGPGQGPGFEPGFRGLWMGMHMAGGLVVLAVIALLALAFSRRRFHRPVELGGQRHEDDAEGLLRVEFAEGKVSEDEYRGRLAALQDTRRI